MATTTCHPAVRATLIGRKFNFKRLTKSELKLGLGEDCVSEGKVLNRIVRCSEDGWSLEADTRHAELIIEQLGGGDLRSTATPGIDGIDEVDREDDVEITGSDATRF